MLARYFAIFVFLATAGLSCVAQAAAQRDQAQAAPLPVSQDDIDALNSVPQSPEDRERQYRIIDGMSEDDRHNYLTAKEAQNEAARQKYLQMQMKIMQGRTAPAGHDAIR
jgi:hypothetical protein